MSVASPTPRIPKFINTDRESTAQQFNLGRTDASGLDVAWWNGIQSSDITIYLTGFDPYEGAADFAGILINDPNYRLRIDWYLHAGAACAIDDEPVWESTTWWAPQGNVLTPKMRRGRLVQTSGLASDEWLLRAVIADPGFNFSLTGTLAFRIPPQPVIGGPVSSVGNFVG